jgi:hypothetical protein
LNAEIERNIKEKGWEKGNSENNLLMSIIRPGNQIPENEIY